jgi:hypothetical protein
MAFFDVVVFVFMTFVVVAALIATAEIWIFFWRIILYLLLFGVLSLIVGAVLYTIGFLFGIC